MIINIIIIIIILSQGGAFLDHSREAGIAARAATRPQGPLSSSRL